MVVYKKAEQTTYKDILYRMW